MSVIQIFRCLLLSLLILHFTSVNCFAEWDLSTVRTTGGDCVVRERQIDETKLTLRFFDFVLRYAGDNPGAGTAREQCSINVQFRVPARHRLKTLTHRILFRTKKDPFLDFKMSADVSIAGTSFHQLGHLPYGSEFDGRLLLYKSFNVSSLLPCENFDQHLDVTSQWIFEMNSRNNPHAAFADLTGEQEWADLWLETESC